MRSRYSGAVIGGTGPISTTLVPPRVEPPLGPSVKSQTLPATSAGSDVGPAAACACASVGKFSICQYSGPAGSWLSFFSATGLMTNCCCAAAVDGDSNIPIVHSKTANATRRGAPDVRSFIVLLVGLIVHACGRQHSNLISEHEHRQGAPISHGHRGKSTEGY